MGWEEILLDRCEGEGEGVGVGVLFILWDRDRRIEEQRRGFFLGGGMCSAFESGVWVRDVFWYGTLKVSETEEEKN